MTAALTAFDEAVDVCTRMFASIDSRDWSQFEEYLAPTVITDFTALWGGAPQRDRAADLATNWSRLFAGFAATQHLVTGYASSAAPAKDHQVTLDAVFQATHVGDDPFGSAVWTVYGTYRIGLDRVGDDGASDSAGLRVAGLYQTPTFGTGNRNIVLRAAARAQHATESAPITAWASGPGRWRRSTR